MISASNLSKAYDVAPVIKNVNLELKESSIFGLIGANGAGKTTLIKLLCGIYRPDAGVVTLDGLNVSDNAKARENIYYVPDNIMFYNNFTVKDMREFYSHIYPTWSDKRYQTLREVFTFSDKKKIKQLSKGMKTQLSILIALSCMPKIILMDEPTSGLDPFIRREVLNLIVQDVISRGTSILISTHNISELEQISDTVAFMDKGEIKMTKEMEELKTKYKKVQIAFEGEMTEEFKQKFNPNITRQYGKVYEIIVDMDFEVFKQASIPFHPILVEKMDMTLEEIFIYAMGGENYVKQVTI